VTCIDELEPLAVEDKVLELVTLLAAEELGLCVTNEDTFLVEVEPKW
jgi:hypothetical protein